MPDKSAYQDKMSEPIMNMPVNGVQGITDETMAYQVAGASLTDAIAATVMNDIKGIAPEPGSLRMNRYATDEVKEQHQLNDDLFNDKIKNELLKDYKPLPSGQREGQQLLDPLKEHKEQKYDYQQQYQQYEQDRIDPPEKLVDKLGYRDEQGKIREDKKPELYGALELLTYSQLVDQHIRESLEGHLNPEHSQHYLVSDGKYSALASVGYMPESGLNYLVLNLYKDGEEQQSYTIITKDDEEFIKHHMEEELQELVQKMEKKDKVETEDALETLKKIMKKNEKSEEILEFIEKIKKEKLNKKNEEDKLDLRFLFDQEKSVSLLNHNKKYNLIYKKSKDYSKEIEKRKNDFTHLLDKSMSTAPISIMGGVLGYTFLGDGFMVIRDDLAGEASHEVQLHEAIHTHDEYETRVITKWMLEGNTKYH